MENAVEIRDLSTGYKVASRVSIVSHSLNGNLHKGSLTVLLGPNGSGKSTLLKTLSAFLPAIEGEVIIEGIPLKEYSPHSLAETIGVVLTDRPAVTNMTVDQLIATGRSPYNGFWGRSSAEDKEIIERALNLTDIIELRHRKINSLSDGERQKVMIAKALAQETPLIFLDEPTAFLDYPGKVEIMLLLRRLAEKESKTIFLSTHDLEIALQLAHNAWLIDKNKGFISGTPKELGKNGDIGRYFDSDNMKYEASSGRFLIRNSE